MRQLIVTENLSLDGIMSPMDGWFDPTKSGDDLLSASAEHRASADALVLGRVTFEEFAGFWPYQDDVRTGVSDYLNRVSKYVVSTRLDSTEWQKSTILRGPVIDELSALKNAEGRDIVVTGSAELVRSLQPSGLIDAYRLFVYPVVQGRGRRLFVDGVDVALELTDVRRFASGVVLLEYRAAAPS